MKIIEQCPDFILVSMDCFNCVNKNTIILSILLIYVNVKILICNIFSIYLKYSWTKIKFSKEWRVVILSHLQTGS